MLKELRSLQAEAGELAADHPYFRRVESKIGLAANAVGVWLDENKEPAPSPVEKPASPPPAPPAAPAAKATK